MADFATGQFVDAPDLNPVTFDSGDVKYSARRNPATGWLKADGAAVSRSTYAVLFAAIVPLLGTFTVTIASPGVFTLVAHGLIVGDRVYLTTTGALPTGLSANTIYYVVSTPTANTFTVSATSGGSAINTTGSQSGVHSLYFCPFGLGNGSTTFNTPDIVGRVVAGRGDSGHADVQSLGLNEGSAVANRRPKHPHTVTDPQHNHGGATGSVGFQNVGQTNSGNPSMEDTGPPNDLGNHTHTIPAGATGISVGVTGTANDAPANIVLNAFVKT